MRHNQIFIYSIYSSTFASILLFVISPIALYMSFYEIKNDNILLIISILRVIGYILLFLSLSFSLSFRNIYMDKEISKYVENKLIILIAMVILGIIIPLVGTAIGIVVFHFTVRKEIQRKLNEEAKLDLFNSVSRIYEKKTKKSFPLEYLK